MQAIDARKAAVDEVERLLQHPEDLKRLDGLLEEYTQKHQAMQLSLDAYQLGTAAESPAVSLQTLDASASHLCRSTRPSSAQQCRPKWRPHAQAWSCWKQRSAPSPTCGIAIRCRGSRLTEELCWATEQQSAPHLCTILFSRTCQLWQKMERPPELWG